MKRILALAFVFTAITMSTFSQEKREMKHEKNGMHKKKGKKNHELIKSLDLTESQKTQMKANREEYKKQMQLLSQQQNITVQEMNTRKAALKKEQKAKMESLLTSEQKNKMAQARLQHDAAIKQRTEKRLDKMKSKLALSDDQVNRLRIQSDASRSQMKAIRENESLSPDVKKQQIAALKTTAKEQRKNILTAEQIKKMEELKQDHKSKQGKRVKK